MHGISGIPRGKNEDVIEELKKVVSKVDIKRSEENQVGVAHRTSKRETAPIIVKFAKKNDRMNFYRQRKKVYNLKANEIVPSADCSEEDEHEEVTINNNIYINESLTMYNKSLLKESRN